MSGRKRHVLVDTMGNLLAVLVLAADIADRDGAALLLSLYAQLYPLLQKLWADHAYSGDLIAEVEAAYGIDLAIVQRCSDQNGFTVQPRRWVVERTLAWLTRCRRLVRDYEHDPTYSEAWIYMASIHRTLKRLAPDESVRVAYYKRRAA